MLVACLLAPKNPSGNFFHPSRRCMYPLLKMLRVERYYIWKTLKITDELRVAYEGWCALRRAVSVKNIRTVHSSTDARLQ